MEQSNACVAAPGAPFRQNRLLQGLAGVWAALWVWAAIEPNYRFDWFLENILLIAAVVLLAVNHRRHPFSDRSYVLIAAFLMLHTYATHYTYSETPLGAWMAEIGGFERNHFDRVVHASFGFLLAYPALEYLVRGLRLTAGIARWLVFLGISTASLLYEIVEWLVVLVVNPEAGMAFLGTQGDVFDAQKDSALAMVGAAVVLLVHWRVARRRYP